MSCPIITERREANDLYYICWLFFWKCVYKRVCHWNQVKTVQFFKNPMRNKAHIRNLACFACPKNYFKHNLNKKNEKLPNKSTADPFQVPKFEFACQLYKNGCRYVIKDFITSCYEIFLILSLNMGIFSRLSFVKSVIFFRFEMWNQFWECQPPESTTIFMWNIDIFFLVTI